MIGFLVTMNELMKQMSGWEFTWKGKMKCLES